MSACIAVIEELHKAIIEKRNMEELENFLWQGCLHTREKLSIRFPGWNFPIW